MGAKTEIRAILDADTGESGPVSKSSGINISFRQLMIMIPLLGGTSLGGGVFAAKATDDLQDQKIEAIEVKLERVASETAETTLAVGKLETAATAAKSATDIARNESREDMKEIRDMLIEALARP